jgi:quercetin dioxygenase-like cupin family protein
MCDEHPEWRYSGDPKAPYFRAQLNVNRLREAKTRASPPTHSEEALKSSANDNTKPISIRIMKSHSCFPNLSKALTAALVFANAVVQGQASDEVKVTELMTKDLMNVPGKEVTMITVDYPPGGADPVHRHNASAFVYVLEGSIVMQMKGGEKVTLHPGDTFYEDPEGVHLVGKNASETKPAKFVVVLVKVKGAPILIPVSE